jgi:GNAT superfamily N-acetyltransferase
MAGDVSIHPLTSDRWDDLVTLFGPRGAQSGCWCMWFRVANAGWWAAGNAGNRTAFEGLVRTERVPGLLAYLGGQPVGWVSVSPRAEYRRIVGEVTGEPGSDPVWSVVCFYIHRDHRRAGIAHALLEGAIAHARVSGATILEAYPVDSSKRVPVGSAYTGLRTMFERAGFRETGRFDRWRSAPHASDPLPPPLRKPPGRPVMRLDLHGGVGA